MYRFGKTRGYTDETRRYVYAKLYNAQAFNACSNMPRFGYKGIRAFARSGCVSACRSALSHSWCGERANGRTNPGRP